MKVEMRPIDDLKTYEKQLRRNVYELDYIAESIRQFGFRQPIVVDKDYRIICGDARWKAAKKLGLDEVPVHVAVDLTPEQARSFRITANVVYEHGKWDWNALFVEIRDLDSAGVDWSKIGFLEADLNDFLDPEYSEPDEFE